MKYFRNDSTGHVVRAVSGTESLYDGPGWTKVSAAKGKAACEQQSCDSLLESLFGAAPGSKHALRDGKVQFWTIVRSVSASGMSRVIDVYVIVDNEMHCLTYHIAIVLGWKLHKDRGMIVNGCGMDMCYHAVDSLWRRLGLNGKGVEFEVRSI
jgi:hypothetical protein